jgi:hypothetical protein
LAEAAAQAEAVEAAGKALVEAKIFPWTRIILLQTLNHLFWSLEVQPDDHLSSR